MAADRPEAAVGHGQPVQPPALRGRRSDQPRSGGLRLRRGPGQVDARGHPSAGRRELRPVGRPRGLRDPAQHRPGPRRGPARPLPAPGRRAQAPDRLQGHAPDRAQAPGADQAPVRLRRRHGPAASSSATTWPASTGSTSRSTTPPWPATASSTRLPWRSPTGCSAASTPTGATTRTAGTPTSSRTRSTSSPWPSTRSSGPAAFTTGGFNFDTKLRRQSMDHDDLFHAHIGGIDTLAQSLLVAAAMIESGELERLRTARYAGWSGALGRSILSGDALLEMLAGRVLTGEIDPQARVRSPGAPRERGQPPGLVGQPALTSMAFVLGIDVSTTATKAVLVDEAGAVRAIGTAELRLREPASALERAAARAVVGRHPGRGAIGPGRRRGARRGRRGGRADRPDARPRPARPGRAGPPAGDPLERPADGGRVRADPAGRRARAPDPDHRQRRPDRLHRARSSSGSATTNPRSGPGSPTSCCPRTTSA